MKSLYARGWLLTHYMTFEPARRGQLDRYLDGIARGDAPLDAARSAFGDLRQLEKELNAYVLRRRACAIFPSRPRSIQIGVDRYSAAVPGRGGGAAAADAVQARRECANRRSARRRSARRRASYPGDPLVEVTLAEAEVDVGNAAAAEAAADRALKADPKMIEAMIYKGRAIMTRAQASKSAADWTAARDWFLAANKADSEDPEPLMLFYQSFREGRAQTHRQRRRRACTMRPTWRRRTRACRLNSAMQYLRDQEAEGSQSGARARRLRSARPRTGGNGAGRHLAHRRCRLGRGARDA